MRHTTLLLAALCWCTFFAGLGRPAIGDNDEAFYAQAAREMVASGDWLTPHYNFEPRFQKPILFYWLVGASYRIAGVSEASARLPAALAGFGLALLAAACARRWYDEPTARLAGAITATTFGYFSMARLALPDLPLALFVTAAIWTGLVGLTATDGRNRRWLVTSGAAMGLAVLTKGPVGLVLPLLVLLAVWLLEWPGTLPARSDLALSAAAAAAIGLPWYAAMAAVHGPAYLSGFFVGDNVERFLTTRFNEPRTPVFYVPVIAGGLMPWTPLAMCAVPRAAAWLRGRVQPSRPALWLVLWAALPVLFFTLSVGKQPRYVLPVLPPLAILVARGLLGRLDRPGRHRLVTAAAVATGFVLVLLGLLVYRVLPYLVAVAPGIAALAAGAIVAAGLLVVIVGARGPRGRIPAAIIVASALTLLALQYGLSPGGRDPVQQMAVLVVQHHEPGVPVATFRMFVRNLVFYTGLKQTDLSSDDAVRRYLSADRPVLCVVDAGELARITAGSGLRTRTLGRVPYFDASAVNLRLLLDPERRPELLEVLLVTNR